MSVATGRSYLAIPGPSVLPERVLNAMHRAAPNIYEGALIDMTQGLVRDLKHLAGTRHEVAIYVANGHAAWEAAVSNVLAPGDRVLVLATGVFASDWGAMATAIGAQVEVMDFGKRAPIDATQVAKRLEQDPSHQIKAVMCVHVDTGTSVRNDIPALRAALDGAGHPALLMVDCIASMGCEEYRMDDWGVDITVTASQKGLMTPPGLGFVWFNQKAAQRRQAMAQVSRYWDWAPRTAPRIFSHYWNGTAPTHHLFALREALDMIAEEGLNAVWRRHEILARTYWAACEAWQMPGGIALNIADPNARSHAVTALSCAPPDASRLRAWCQTHTGVTLGIGLGMADEAEPAWHGHFRIGHMGHLNAHMVMGVIGVIDAGLKALAIPHGRGATEAASASLASELS